MPVLFGIFGIILIVAGVRDRVTNGDPSLMSLIKGDFTGTNPFWKWMLAILFIGALGYIPTFKPISRGFLVLIIVVFFLSNKGFFTQLQSTLNSTSTSGTGSTSTTTTQSPLANNTVNDFSTGEDSLLQLANTLGVK